MNFLEAIYKNEEVWLKHIGCTITKNSKGVLVNNIHNLAPDFNYFLFNNDVHLKDINYNVLKYRHSDLNLMSDRYIEDFFKLAFKNSYHRESSCDVQLFLQRNTTNQEEVTKSFKMEKNEFAINEFTSILMIKDEDVIRFQLDKLDQYRNFSVGKFYFFYILFNGEIAGKINILNEAGIFGIYDFEVFEKYQRKGIGKTVLSFIINNLLKNQSCFIQTWIENYNALTLYKSLGFREVDYYYYFIRQGDSFNKTPLNINN